ncbi:hypothetical protein BB559_001277 [Furculomyces boomerangus]|nr:hypothetical protein BB559_001277 [Furculomyces boomerangus]PWA01174.1 hypothetical protein BB558_002760 [Smittium angustum]
MKTIYDSNAGGWNDTEKMNEMFDKDMRYIVLLSYNYIGPGSESPKGASNDKYNNCSVICFTSFMFTFEETNSDYEIPVLYCYELQVTGEFRGQGLGKSLIESLKAIGKMHKMKKLMLTTYKDNTNATLFYKKIGFSVDEISPSKYISSSENEEIGTEQEGSSTLSNGWESEEFEIGYDILSIDLSFGSNS